jgi:hypothetical protein
VVVDSPPAHVGPDIKLAICFPSQVDQVTKLFVKIHFFLVSLILSGGGAGRKGRALTLLGAWPKAELETVMFHLNSLASYVL